MADTTRKINEISKKTQPKIYIETPSKYKILLFYADKTELETIMN